MSGAREDVLLPCPFCGGKAEWHNIGNEHTKSRSTKIWCSDCRFSKNVGAIRHSLEWTMEHALAAWNRRAPASDDALAKMTAERDRALSERAACMSVLLDSGPPDHKAEVLRIHGEKCDWMNRALVAETALTTALAERDALREALKAALGEIKAHNREYRHRTSPKLIAEFTALATKEPSHDDRA